MIMHPTKLKHMQIAEQILEKSPILGDKIAAAVSLDKALAPKMLGEVLRFLHLVVWSGKKLTPPHILDLAWHEFILFTRVYSRVCQEYFGRFIHHEPGGEEAENRGQLRQALKLYQLCFGAPSPVFWGEHGYYAEDAGCGACKSAVGQSRPTSVI